MMICIQREMATVYEVMEALERKDDGQQFSSRRRVIALRGRERASLERDVTRCLALWIVLVEHCAYAHKRSISSNAERKLKIRVRKRRALRDEVLESLK